MHHYRRVLVMVREGHAEAPPFYLAAELAHLLQVELEGIFVEDEALVFLSGLPFARELRLPGHTWQALDAAAMREHLRMAESEARRLLADAAARLGVPSTFSVERGDPYSALTEHARPEDILVLAEPGAVRAGAFRRAGRKIFRDRRSAVLLVPARQAERHGSIALLLPTGGPEVVAVAAAIAHASAEDVVLIVPEGAGAAAARAEAALKEAGMPPARIKLRHVPGHHIGLITRAVRVVRARLVVLDEAGFGGDVQGSLAYLLADAGTAVLLLGKAPGSGPDA
ncbi:MAG: hypothetical protein ACREFP_00765 [Acetobacteraceae bacterium]